MQLSPTSYESVCISECVCLCVDSDLVFALRCNEITVSQSLQIFPAAFLNDIKHRLLKPFCGTTWNVCRMHVWCYTGVKQKRRAGAIVSAEVEGQICCLFTVRKYDLRAPASSQRITWDRGESPLYKSPALLLFSFPPSSLSLAQYAVSSK